MKRLLLLSIILLTACGPSDEEKRQVAAITCSVMSETRNMDGAVRVREMNDARTKIEGKASLTNFKVIRTVRSLRSQCLSLLELYPETGRTHQLRIHCSESGYPILGDKLYGPEGNTLKHKGLFLAATGLIFEDGSDFQIKPPAKFDSFMKGEARRYNKYH